MNLNISERQMAGVTVLDLSGRLVLGEETSTFRDRLKTLISDGQKKILLNMASVTYLDSSGLGALVAGYTTVSAQQGQLKLVNLNNKVHDLLRMTKLLTVFETFDDERKAIGSFR
ncbi:MAG: STAS domain-containing protein [Acidobacteria bacterium]|nr:STAS domain-containing protein [Acidobacteriota bacterium]